MAIVSNFSEKARFMFDFEDNSFTHMPYCAYGKDGGIIQTCCMMVDGKWKVHLFKDGKWERVNTQMPEDATECSPFIEYDPVNDRTSMTFIGGASLLDDRYMRFAIYRIDDINHPSIERIVNAGAGFMWKHVLVHAGLIGGIDIEKDDERVHLDLKGCKYIYRVISQKSIMTLLVSGMKDDESIFTWLIDMYGKKVFQLSCNGEPLYKPCFMKNEWYYCHRSGEDFEDRHIVKAEDVQMDELNWDESVIYTVEKLKEEEDD